MPPTISIVINFSSTLRFFLHTCWCPLWPLWSPNFHLFPRAHACLAHYITIIILIFITIIFISLPCTCDMWRGAQACYSHSSDLEVFWSFGGVFLDMKWFQLLIQQGHHLWFKPQFLVPQQIHKQICLLLHFDVTNLQSAQLQRLL